jgi:hypothetical protein
MSQQGPYTPWGVGDRLTEAVHRIKLFKKKFQNPFKHNLAKKTAIRPADQHTFL